MILNYNPRFITINRIIVHLLFWLVYFFYVGLVFGSFEFRYNQIFSEILMVLPVRIIATYFTLYVLFPLFLDKKKYSLFILGFILSAILFGLLQNVIYHYLVIPEYYPKFEQESIFYFPRLFKGLINIYFVVSVAATIKLLKKWYHEENHHREVEKQHLEAELNLLKAQVHPHFLFNTLNNLYALTLKRSEKASEVVLKLSELLSYMLYECNAPKVMLNKEIDLINNYIELEKLRYSDRLEIKTSYLGETSGIKIAPMIILPFVENSFKHGAGGSLAKPWINIEIQVNSNFLVLKIINGKDTTKSYAKFTEGIGLKNVKRRLDLLYPNLYDLQIIDENNTFQVILTLNIAE